MNEAPLNYLQRYILHQQQVRPGATMFNLAKLFRLKKGLDIEKFAECLAKAGRAHQALLSMIHRYPDGAIMQRQYLDDDDIQVEIVKVHEGNFLQRRQSYVKIFNTFDEGLVDAIIFKCDDNAYLLSNIHHLVCDGYSFPLILSDAKRAWDGENLEQDRYYEVLARRQARGQSAVAVAARQLVHATLRSCDFMTLPRYDLSGNPGYGSQMKKLSLPEGLDARLERMRVTRHHFFLAATAKALSLLTDASDIEVDWVFHGRLSKEEMRTVGAFMVDLPFACVGLAEMSADDLMQEVKGLTFFGIKNVYAVTDSENDPRGGERLTFVYQSEWSELVAPGPIDPEGPFAWMFEEVLPLAAPRLAAENPFNVEILERRDGTYLFLEYDTGRYRSETVSRYAACYQSAVEWLLR